MWLIKWDFKQPLLNYSENPKVHTTFKCLGLCQELVFTQQLKDSQRFWHFYNSQKKVVDIFTSSQNSSPLLLLNMFQNWMKEYPLPYMQLVKEYIQTAKKIYLKINVRFYVFFYVFHQRSQLYRIGIYCNWTISGIWVSGRLLSAIQEKKKFLFMLY